MLSKSQYEKIMELRTTNPEIYELITDMRTKEAEELSIASHDIKNLVTYFHSSYQLLNRKSPELQKSPIWINAGNTIKDLINFMDRTSLYRYSRQSQPNEEVDINAILYALPDYADDVFDSDRSYNYDLLNNLPKITANAEMLEMLFHELITNAYEASPENSTIKISSYVSENSVYVIIKNQQLHNDDAEAEELNLDVLSKPFHTTKEKHIGVGLSIVHQICLIYKAQFKLETKNNLTSAIVIFPLSCVS